MDLAPREAIPVPRAFSRSVATTLESEDGRRIVPSRSYESRLESDVVSSTKKIRDHSIPNIIQRLGIPLFHLTSSSPFNCHLPPHAIVHLTSPLDLECPALRRHRDRGVVIVEAVFTLVVEATAGQIGFAFGSCFGAAVDDQLDDAVSRIPIDRATAIGALELLHVIPIEECVDRS